MATSGVSPLVPSLRRLLMNVRSEDPAHPSTGWRSMVLIVAGVSLWQGVIYAGGAFNSHRIQAGWYYVLGGEGHNLRVHGVIMALLGLALLAGLRGPFDRYMLWTIRVLRTYSIIVAICWIGSWFRSGPSLGAPGWWLLLAALTIWLGKNAPPLREARRSGVERV